MDQALMEALETIQQELRKIDFYGQAADDTLVRLQGTFDRAQRTDADRLDRSIQMLRELTRDGILALEAALRSALARHSRPVKHQR